MEICRKNFFWVVKVGHDQIVPAKIFPPFFGQMAVTNKNRGKTRIVQAANAVDLDSLKCERGHCFVCQNVYLRLWKGIAQRANGWQSQEEIAQGSTADDQETPATNTR